MVGGKLVSARSALGAEGRARETRVTGVEGIGLSVLSSRVLPG